jgi:uncharacterized membrane protein
MNPEELERRLAELEYRLTRLEANAAPLDDAPKPPPPTPIEPILAAEIDSPRIIAEPRSGRPEGALLPADPISRITTGHPEHPGPADFEPSPLPHPVAPLHYQIRPVPTPPPRSGLEQAIGLRWAGWIGAVVLVISGGLAVKFAYDQGWWQGLPPAFRLTTMSLAGVALLGAGEWVYRKINVIASASLFGAGIAIFLLVSYAGSAYYGLYSRNSALVLMAISTLVGAATALRGNMVSIAVLALIGGNIAPLVLSTDHPHITPFLGYLLMLQVVALFLAWWGTQGKWWTLRGMSLATTSLWVFAILLDRRNLPAPPVFLGFLVLFASLYHAELILSATRRTARFAPRGGVFAILVTAAFMSGVLWVEDQATPGWRGAWVLGSCAAAGIIGALLRRAGPESPLRLLSASYWLQAGALLVLAVPVMFKGIHIPLGWGAMALAFAIYGAIGNLQSARSFALGCWLLSLGALLCISTGSGPDIFAGPHQRAPVVWLHISSTAIYDTTIIAWLLALIGHAIASLNARRPEATRGHPVRGDFAVGLLRTTVFADAVWVLAAITALNPLPATLALIIFAWLLASTDPLDHRPNWAVHSVAILMLATIKWALVDMLSGFWSVPTSILSATHYAPVLNPLLGAGLLLAISLAAEFWFLRRRLSDVLSQWLGFELDARRAFLAGAAAVIAIITFGLTCEIQRAVDVAVMHARHMVWPPRQLVQLAWTILWMAATCSFIALAYFIETPERRGGWLRRPAKVPLILAAKFLLIDTVFFRIQFGAAPAMVGANLQTLAGLVILGGLSLAWFVGRWPDDQGNPAARLQFTAAAMASLVLLWCGTLEIDRACERIALAPAMALHAQFAKQVAWSIYWSLFALASVAVGFQVRSSAVRYFGLGLFGLTLLKVVVVDLSQVGRGYRIFSFMALGLLLLGTSVLYGKLTPRLAGKNSP